MTPIDGYYLRIVSALNQTLNFFMFLMLFVIIALFTLGVVDGGHEGKD